MEPSPPWSGLAWSGCGLWMVECLLFYSTKFVVISGFYAGWTGDPRGLSAVRTRVHMLIPL
jgi:hypothetical protein